MNETLDELPTFAAGEDFEVKAGELLYIENGKIYKIVGNN